MKKLKVILPAAGIILLSGASAITGTFAWFTATRTAKITASTLTVSNGNANLGITIKNEKGCFNNSGTIIFGAASNTTSGNFRDASVDMSQTQPVVYRPVEVNAEGTPGGFKAVTDSNYKDQNVYCANAFTIDFELDKTSTETEYLYFDAAESETKSVELSPAEVAIKNAIRVGFRCDTEWFVWAPFRQVSETALATNKNYINSETAPGIATLAAENIADTETAFPTDTATKAKAHHNFLGELKTSGVAKSVVIYTWFEGTDADCTDTALKNAGAQKFSLSLNFKIGQTASEA